MPNWTGSRTFVVGLCWAQSCDSKAAAQDDGGQRDDSLSATQANVLIVTVFHVATAPTPGIRNMLASRFILGC